jgi:formylmethanofuran dehydrogenase subunit B
VRNGRIAIDQLGCAKARAGFELALRASESGTESLPRLRGRHVPWDQALAHAAELLTAARLPLFDGLLGDLQDSRAALQLAGRFGGVIDHLHGEAAARALSVYQDSGWILTSLGEVRNRADLLILLGDDLHTNMPRLKEKLIDVPQRLHREQAPPLIELSEDRLTVLSQARALLGGRPLPTPIAAATELSARLGASQYPVFVIGALSGTRAELILRAAAELVRDLNAEGRAALLNLGSGLGEVTAQLAAAWHNGFGLRTSFARSYPQQDPQRYAGWRTARPICWCGSAASVPNPCPAPPRPMRHPVS